MFLTLTQQIFLKVNANNEFTQYILGESWVKAGNILTSEKKHIEESAFFYI